MVSLASSASPTPITRSDIALELDGLLDVELDAIASYHAAIERTQDAGLGAQLAVFQEDHEGHLQDLSTAVQRLGGRPRTHTDFRRISTESRIAVGSGGRDRALLDALRTCERDAVARYDEAMRRCGAASPAIKEMLARHLHDERNARAGLDRLIAEIATR